MEYFFILGSNTTLSVAEIFCFFQDIKSYKLLNDDVFIVEFGNKINHLDAIKRLGGTIKIGEVTGRVRGRIEYDDIGHMFATKKDEKFKFGISCYSRYKKINFNSLGMEIKSNLIKKGISCRLVTSKEKTLSSVVVEQNKLTSKGIEIVIIEDGKEFLVGKTLIVQQFKDLSFRDYNRPARDDQSGMLPPKLAQMMINLSGKNYYKGSKTDLCLLDPFCGSGTVITEALLMGFDCLIGSDISEKAVGDTKKNVSWIIDNYELKNKNYKLINNSVLDISKKVKNNSVDVIVTEPYLGPQRGQINFDMVKKELEELYTGAIKEFGKILKNNGRIVMLFPVFRINNESRQISPRLDGFKIINVIPHDLTKNKLIKLTGRSTIVYGRENQRVWRELVILGK